MVRICFINPPVRESDVAKHIPYGIAQLAAIADDWGAQVGVEDVNMLRVSHEQVSEDLAVEVPEYGKWDIIALSGMVTTYKWQKKAAQLLKHDFPDSFIIAGGGCASALHDRYLKWVPEIDAIAIGEGDITLVELLERANRGKLWDSDMVDQKGLYIRDDYDDWANFPEKANRRRRQFNKLMEARRKKSDIVFTGMQAYLTEEEMNDLPYPAWYLFNLMPTVEDGKPIRGYFANSSLGLSMAGAASQRRLDAIWERGCAGDCRFCSHNLMGGDYLRPDHCELYGDQWTDMRDDIVQGVGKLKPFLRYQSPEYAVSMVRHMRETYRIDFLAVMDETMLWNMERTFKFIDGLEALGYTDLPLNDFHWGCLGRAENVDEGLLLRLKEGKCTYISYGFETSSQRMLNYLDKHNTTEDQSKALKYTKESGITPITSYIVGFPGESMQTLYDTARFMTLNGIWVKPFFYTPYLYTRAYWESREVILDKYGDEETFVEACGDAYDFVINLTKFTDAELLGLREMVAHHNLEGLRDHSVWRVSEGLDDRSEMINDPNPPTPGPMPPEVRM